MKDSKKKKHWWRWGLYLLLSPFVLFIILSVLIYIPPVQRYIVDRVMVSLSESTGVDVSIERVRLAFPLDLSVDGVLAKSDGKVIADVRSLKLDIPLKPLFSGKVDVEGFGLYDANVNTYSLIPDVYLRGQIGQLTAAIHSVDLKKEEVHLDFLLLENSNLYMALGDTAEVAEEDTVPVKWKIVSPEMTVNDVALQMSMPGDSMRVGFSAKQLGAKGLHVDLGQEKYLLNHLDLNNGKVAYVVRSAWNDGSQGNAAFQREDSLVWSGIIPQSAGLDPNYISIDSCHFSLNNLIFEGNGNLAAQLRQLSLTERSGMNVQRLAGNLSLIDNKLSLQDGSFRTPTSHLDFAAVMSLDSLLSDSVHRDYLTLLGELSSADIKTLANGFLDEVILDAWPASPMKVNVDVDGDARHVKVDTFNIDWSSVATMQMDGEMFLADAEQPKGAVNLNIQTYDLSFVPSMFSLGDMGFTLPSRLAIKGKAQVNGDTYLFNMDGTAGSGHVKLNGKLNQNLQRYQADLLSSHFPLQQFLPKSGVGPLSASLKVSGRGFDPMRKSAIFKGDMSVDTLRWNDWQLGTVKLNADLANGKGVLNLDSYNDILEGTVKADVCLDKDMTLKLRSDITGLNIQKLADMDSSLTFGTVLSIDAYANKKFTVYGFEGGLKNIHFITADKGIMAKDLDFNFATTKDTTVFNTSSGDLNIFLSAGGGLDYISKGISRFASVAQKQMDRKRLNQADLKKAAPNLQLHIDAGASNPIVNLFREMGYSYKTVNLNLSMSPLTGAVGDAQLAAFSTGDFLLDTLSFQLSQDTSGLIAKTWVKNSKKRNPTKFEGSLNTYLRDNGVGAELSLYTDKGVKGMNFGLFAHLKNKGVNIHLYPENPVIAFRQFHVNKDNYLYFGADSTILADIDMLANDGTGLRLKSQSNDSVNDLTMSLNRLNLAELCKGLPYLPRMTGFFSGDVHVMDDHKTLSAMASVEAENLSLEEAPLGNVGMEVVYLPKDGGEHHANAYVTSNGNEVLTVNGIYRSEGKNTGFEGDAELWDFPLDLLNGFLVGTDVALSGKAEGNLSVRGDMNAPKLNGQLSFVEAHMFSDAYGFNFEMDDQPVLLTDNQLVLTNYRLYSKQKTNPLQLNGTLDMRNLDQVRMDFFMDAENFELINAKKTDKSLVFGKVYTDFNGSLRGTLEDLSVRGKLSILDRTDMTYILKDSPLTVDDRLHDLVQFVDFEEVPDAVVEEVTPMMNLNVTMGIAINNAALFHCNLSEDGANYVDLEGGGDLTLRLTQQGDMRLTGRFTATSGEMKYSLPVIPLKTFKLVPGSYVDFTGDVANPTLNIAALERVKAMVTENDQPRSVAFDVGVKITKPLDQMGLEFTIDAPEDLAVQNQLAAMTKAERGKSAVGMLATGMYFTEESMTSSNSGFKASNALTSFLQSEIQNIAGSALKTIDVTIGMENNTTATGSTTTDYSFQFAKRFWGNRISVIVGGKVSTGAEAENSAESFIDNIAVEYRLDKTASRYVRVFYERSFQDPLEGQLIKTGAGLMLRRKSDRLGDLFIFRNRNSNKKKFENQSKN